MNTRKSFLNADGFSGEALSAILQRVLRLRRETDAAVAFCMADIEIDRYFELFHEKRALQLQTETDLGISAVVPKRRKKKFQPTKRQSRKALKKERQPTIPKVCGAPAKVPSPPINSTLDAFSILLFSVVTGMLLGDMLENFLGIFPYLKTGGKMTTKKPGDYIRQAKKDIAEGIVETEHIIEEATSSNKLATRNEDLGRSLVAAASAAHSKEVQDACIAAVKGQMQLFEAAKNAIALAIQERDHYLQTLQEIEDGKFRFHQNKLVLNSGRVLGKFNPPGTFHYSS